MRFHWVSQNQTGRLEISGGYMWCPKTNKKGGVNPNYEMMRSVEPGDLVFSFQGKSITHVGITVSEAFEVQTCKYILRQNAGYSIAILTAE
jgi:hypothetical protein